MREEDPTSVHNGTTHHEYWIERCKKEKRIAKNIAKAAFYDFRRQLLEQRASMLPSIHDAVTGRFKPKPVHFLLQNADLLTHAKELCVALRKGKKDFVYSNFIPDKKGDFIKSYYLLHPSAKKTYATFLTNKHYLFLHEFAFKFFQEMDQPHYCAEKHYDYETKVGSVVVILSQSHKQEKFNVFTRSDHLIEITTQIYDCFAQEYDA